MSRQARIEEVSDSDPEEIDISSLPSAPTLPIATSSFTPGRNPNAPASSSPSFSGNPTLVDPAQIPTQAAQAQYINSTDASTYKFFQCLYPVYFDVTRSRADGRKVDKSRAVKNPLAREIADACGSLGLRTMFEPGKTHPKDWANPGRVRVLLKLEGESVHPVLTNKFLLFRAVGEHLQSHPATPETPLKLRIPNVPFDGKPAQPPVVPRGWKMSYILPLHSPALSGGGVTDDIFKEMLQGMGMGDALPSGSGSAGAIKEKKEKKKGKK